MKSESSNRCLGLKVTLKYSKLSSRYPQLLSTPLLQLIRIVTLVIMLIILTDFLVLFSNINLATVTINGQKSIKTITLITKNLIEF